jgi:hypothetical protein
VAFQGSSGFQGCIGFTGPIPGTNTQIVFNDSGFANTSSGLFYQKDIQTLTIGNNLYVGGNIFVTGNVTTFAANNLQIVDNMFYLNSNSQFSNPDIGFAANYNDGTYHHTGFFRDHLDGRWKIFENYAPEPQASQYIDQSNNTFRLADFQSNALYTTYVSISNDLNIHGNTVIGSDNNDVISFNALVNTAIVPAANNTYDLGSDNLRWKSLYISGNTIVLGTQSVSSNSSGMALSGTINANLAANSITINGDVVVGNTYLNDTFSTNSYNYSTYVSNTYLNTIPSIGYVSNVYFNDYTPVSNGYFNHYVPTSNSYINATYLTIDAFTSYNPVSNDYLTGVNTISLTNTNISSVLNVSNTVNSYYINAYSIFYNNFIQNIPVDKDFGDVSGSLDAFGVQLSSIIFDCNSQGSLTIFDAEI